MEENSALLSSSQSAVAITQRNKLVYNRYLVCLVSLITVTFIDIGPPKSTLALETFGQRYLAPTPERLGTPGLDYWYFLLLIDVECFLFLPHLQLALLFIDTLNLWISEKFQQHLINIHKLANDIQF